jgi:hypothetical protein
MLAAIERQLVKTPQLVAFLCALGANLASVSDRCLPIHRATVPT